MLRETESSVWACIHWKAKGEKGCLISRVCKSTSFNGISFSFYKIPAFHCGHEGVNASNHISLAPGNDYCQFVSVCELCSFSHINRSLRISESPSKTHQRNCVNMFACYRRTMIDGLDLMRTSLYACEGLISPDYNTLLPSQGDVCVCVCDGPWRKPTADAMTGARPDRRPVRTLWRTPQKLHGNDLWLPHLNSSPL